MTFQQELSSWNPFGLASNTVSQVPSLGDTAPSLEPLTFPRADGKPVVLTFLRHCGCPFAEKTFLSLRHLASTSSGDISYIAISHSDRASTDAWLSAIGGAGNVEVLIDTDRALYAAWGLGPSSLWHVLNPAALLTVRQIGKDDGINVRPTQSGSRWQTAGSFAVNGAGKVTWGKRAERADEMPDLEEGRMAVA